MVISPRMKRYAPTALGAILTVLLIANTTGGLRIGLLVVLALSVISPLPSAKSLFSHSDRANALSSNTIPSAFSLAGVLLCVAYARHQFPEFLKVGYDDSFITFRYAQNFADFEGLRFNPDDNSNSASSLTFTLLLSIFDRVTPFSFLWNANILNLAGLYAILHWPIRVISSRTNPMTTILVSLPLVGLIGAFPPLVYWTFSGMETTFFLGVLMVAVGWTTDRLRAQTNESLRSDRQLLIILTLLTLTRVEGALTAGTLGLILAFNCWRTAGRGPITSIRALKLLLVSPLMFVAQLIFYWIYYSSPISDPIRFKDLVMYYQRTMSEAADSLEVFLFRVNGPLLLLLGLLSVLFIRTRFNQHHSFLDVVPSVVSFSVLCLFGLRSPYSDEQRYELMLIVPLFALLAYVISEIVSGVEVRSFVGKLVIGLVASGLCFVGVENISLGAQINSRIQTYMYVQQARIDAGNWLERNTARGSRIVSSDIGALSFFNDENVYLDAAGLVNRTQLTAVRTGEDIYKAMKEQRPDFLVDTVDASGVSGVEQILSNPLSYYVPESGAHTSCMSRPIFLKQVLKTFPEVAPAGLQVRVSRIIGFSCE